MIWDKYEINMHEHTMNMVNNYGIRVISIIDGYTVNMVRYMTWRRDVNYGMDVLLHVMIELYNKQVIFIIFILTKQLILKHVIINSACICVMNYEDLMDVYLCILCARIKIVCMNQEWVCKQKPA